MVIMVFIGRNCGGIRCFNSIVHSEVDKIFDLHSLYYWWSWVVLKVELGLVDGQSWAFFWMIIYKMLNKIRS